jgi:hypothetical protein
MKYRVLGLVVAVAAVVLALNVAAMAQEQQRQEQDKNKHTGKLVSVKGDEFTMSSQGKEHKHMLANNAKVMCDGKTCKLNDILPGTALTVTTRPGDNLVAIRVEATTKTTTNKDGK